MCLAAGRAANSGVTYAREDFNWDRVEVRRGTFDWRLQDKVVATAARYGITILPILDDPPAWAGGPLLPTNAPAYARFAARAVARYGPGGTFWRRHRSLPQRPATWFELLNEPYFAIPAGHTPDPGAYARLVAATTPVARAANRRARFLIEAETTYFVAGQPGQYDWIGGMYAAVPDLGRYFDGFAAHPYTNGSPLVWGPTPGDHRYQARRIEDMRAALVAHGDRAKHIWITEIGWSTCQQNEDCVSETAQANYLRELFRLRRTRWRSYVDAIVGYEFRDGEGSDARMAAWGLLRANGAPKPGWYAFTAARPR
jgi:hypothetical protein